MQDIINCVHSNNNLELERIFIDSYFEYQDYEEEFKSLSLYAVKSNLYNIIEILINRNCFHIPCDWIQIVLYSKYTETLKIINTNSRKLNLPYYLGNIKIDCKTIDCKTILDYCMKTGYIEGVKIILSNYHVNISNQDFISNIIKKMDWTISDDTMKEYRLKVITFLKYKKFSQETLINAMSCAVDNNLYDIAHYIIDSGLNPTLNLLPWAHTIVSYVEQRYCYMKHRYIDYIENINKIIELRIILLKTIFLSYHSNPDAQSAIKDVIDINPEYSEFMKTVWNDMFPDNKYSQIAIDIGETIQHNNRSGLHISEHIMEFMGTLL